MFQDIYRRRRVLVTGHTGFKGGCLVRFLEKLGAQVCGVALAPDTEPNHFALLRPACESHIADIRDGGVLNGIFASFRPEIVFHLAAQPLVRRSYAAPAETFDVNVMGTLRVLEACRCTGGVRAVVAVTSDKCYENCEDGRPCCESDPMGGFDPYSASKGCAELVIASYRRSFLGEAGILLASARAGNVIGGGDWAADRLIPDLMRAAASGRPAEIRNPAATRPWQHVWEPLAGYLTLGMRLLLGEKEFAEGWNFGPDPSSGVLTVGEVARRLADSWNRVRVTVRELPGAPHEAKLLALDPGKAWRRLGVRSVWDAGETLRRTALWYRAFYEEGRLLTDDDWAAFVRDAERKELVWTR